MSHNNKRTLNKGETILEDLPSDYVARWDSTTSNGMTFNTDEATGDISSWVDETGTYTLDQTLTNYPTWIPGRVTFGTNMGLQEVTTALDAADMTLFLATSFDGTSGGGTYDYMVVAPNETSIGNNGGIDEKYAFVMDEGGATIYKSTNDLTNTAMVLGIVNDHVGTDDNDKTPYVGKTALTTQSTVSDANSSRGYINIGWYIDATRDVPGEFYELLIYDRVLTTTEREAVVDYLSGKWKAGNEDAASPAITPLQYEIPLDYYERWDASTSVGMAFTTDEATGDIATWAGEKGIGALSLTGTGTAPTWANQRFTTVFDGKHLYDAGWAIATTDDKTIFVVAESIDAASQTSNRYAFSTVGDHRMCCWLAGGASNGPGIMNADTLDYPTNNQDDISAVWALRMTHNGTDDNDITSWLGMSQLAENLGEADSVLTGAPDISFGGYSTSSTWTPDCHVYEVIYYNRALTDAEVNGVVNYLSAKWQSQVEDSASSVITASTERTWVSDHVDPQGTSLAAYTPINHRVEGFPTDPNAPVRGNKSRDPQSDYPALLPNLQTWYRSDYTGGMTFETGDAISGGTISEFTDITGTRTMTKATAGTTNFPTFHPSGAVKGGFPSIEGGDDTTNAGVEASAPSANTSNTQERLFWAVGTFGDATKDTSFCSCMGNILFGGTTASMATDMVAKPVIMYLGSATTGINYIIANGGPPADNGDIHIFVYRSTINGTDADVESWYSGLKLPDRVSSSADSGSIGQSIGLLSTGNFDANGAQFLELGCAYSTTATVQTYTDAHVESLIRYLCDRYNVDYMPETSPITIGCWTRQSTSNALTDCCLWYEPSTVGAGKWPLHPEVAQYHTTPTNFDMATGAEATAVSMTLGTDAVLNTPVISSDETVIANQHIESVNSYTSTETTDFPADTLGMSHFSVLYMDSATVAASGARCGTAISAVRFSGTSDTAIQCLSSNVSKNWSTVNQWILIGNSYGYDDDGTGTEGYPGSTDGGSGSYYYNNNGTMQTAATPAAGSFNVQPWVNWDIADGTCRCAEYITYKHPLTISEINELRKYFIHKYGNNFEFTNIQAHHVDENTVAHWSLDTNALDDTGNKAVFDTGTYTAGTTIYNPYKFGYHDHASGGGFSYSAQDADLDTLGPFTFGAALYLDSLPTGGNWRPVVRSSPPSGGTGINNNHRYTFRIMDDGTLQYQHQYGDKQNVSFATTMTVPVEEWFYLGLSRADDGLSVNVIMNDTIEVLSGFANAPENGANARFELFESWDGDDFRGDARSIIFKNVYTTTGGLLAMKNQVFPHT